MGESEKNMSSIILVLYYLLPCHRASFSHAYSGMRRLKRAPRIPSSVYIGRVIVASHDFSWQADYIRIMLFIIRVNEEESC